MLGLHGNDDMIPRRTALGMQMPANIIFLIFAGFFAWQFIQPALQVMTPAEFPVLTGRVVDEANVLDPKSVDRIAAISERLEKQTGVQLVAVTVPDLQGRAIEEYGYQLGRHWQIGRKDHDDGVLLIAAPNEREVRIEVGYGLEGILTDAVSRLIIQDAILPYFKKNDLPGGMVNGAEAINALLAGKSSEELKGAPSTASQPERIDNTQTSNPLLFVLFPLIFILFPLIQIGRFLYAVINPAYGSQLVRRPRRGNGGGWGGGGGGKPGGRFSGRGGSFGGGGASGRW